MNKRSSAPARIAAVAALALAFVVVLIVIGAALGGDSDDSGGGGGQVTREQQGADPAKKIPATYEVKSGDTLISIAHRMGITVARIEQLNPAVDPQILVAGEQLKLR